MGDKFGPHTFNLFNALLANESFDSFALKIVYALHLKRFTDIILDAISFSLWTPFHSNRLAHPTPNASPNLPFK